MDQILFNYEGLSISAKDIRESLLRMGASACDVLYVHSSTNFGFPNLSLGRSGILEALANILYSLDVSTLIMPTYTFSFCNGETFDCQKSSSSMGALNEYLRTKHQWMRSCDPLMSNILYGRERVFITSIGKQSIGQQCTFDLLTRSNLNVKFLFLGPRMHECFTYMHYLEHIMEVPYRYNFKFKGAIVNNEKKYEDEFELFIRDEGVKAGGGAKIYENMLIESGLAKFKKFGLGSVSIVDLAAARNLYIDLLKQSPNFFIEEIYRSPIRPNNFKTRKMVAL